MDQAGCAEGRVEGELSGAAWLPHRALWSDAEGLHLVHVDRELGVRLRTFSTQTSQEISSRHEQVFPSDVEAASRGLEAIARSPSGDLAIAFAYARQGVTTSRVLLVRGDEGTIWSPPWVDNYRVFGLAWDGEAFTASLMDSALNYAAARFRSDGDIVADATALGHASANYGDYDVETDAATGTTVFAGGALPGVAVVGRHGLAASLTGVDRAWSFSGGQDAYAGFTPAVAVAGDKALIAWADADHGIFAREVALPGGEIAGAWLVGTSPGNFFQQVSAIRAGDHWLVAGQDYAGVVLAELRGTAMSQRRLLMHAPAACTAGNSCALSSEWRWIASGLTLVGGEEHAWVGVVDQSTQRVAGAQTLFNYRLLPANDGCSYQSLLSDSK